MTGIDFLESIIAHLAQTGESIFFFGSKPGVADQAAEKMAEKYPGLKVAGTHHGYFKPEEEADIVAAINESGAYVVSADINSGLNGDTGTGSTYVRSDLTVSIGDFKTGHFLGDSDKAMKDKVNVDIGIEIRGPVEYFE